MATKVIEIHLDDDVVQVELKSAKKSDGIRRAELMALAATMSPGDKNSMVAFYLYPSCIASVKAPQSIRDLSLEDFINRVDEADIDVWLEEAYTLNPQWKTSILMLAEMGADDQKKLGTLSIGSETPTEEPTLMTTETSPSSSS